jgi:hypothetical protein
MTAEQATRQDTSVSTHVAEDQGQSALPRSDQPRVSIEIITCPLTGENIPRCCCPLEK